MEWQKYLHLQSNQQWRVRGVARGTYPAVANWNQQRRPPGRPQPPRAQQVPTRHTLTGPTQHRSNVTNTLAQNYIYAQTCRGLPDVCRRYTKLYIPDDFVDVSANWTTNEDTLDLPLHVALQFENDMTTPIIQEEHEEEEEDPDSPDVTARVMLLSYKPPEVEPNSKRPKPHLSKLLRFLVAKRALGGLMALGGKWSADKDGGSPDDKTTLQRTAIRHCKEICGIDLSCCQNWINFLEINYHRPSGKHAKTVFLVPDVWNHMNNEPYKVQRLVKQVKKEDGSTEEEVLVRSMEISLHGILDYEPGDKHEETTELALFAESFSEMLSARFGKKLTEYLIEKRRVFDEDEAERKRKREEDVAERDAKRKKVEVDKQAEAEAKKQREEEEKNMTPEEIKERRETEAAEKKEKEDALKKEKEEEAAKKKLQEEEKEKEEAAKKKVRTVTTTTTTINDAILEPFSWFDRPFGQGGNQAGVIKRDRLEGVLYSTGNFSQRQVDNLIQPLKLNQTAVLYYRNLATTTTTKTEEIPAEKEEE